MLISSLRAYQPFNEQEATDIDTFIKFLLNNKDAYERANTIAHVTSSAIVTNATKDKVLFIYHNIYQSWGWVGGHNDGNTNCLQVAIEETCEETGLTNVRVLDENLFMVDIIMVPRHMKNGKLISDHLHLNVTYLLEANEQDTLTIKPDENSGVKWFALTDIPYVVKEPHMLPIYDKAVKKLNQLKMRDNASSNSSTKRD
jgi:ADP-ribose pyrophosphatase YjhB (NUDIX family)